MTDRVVCCPNCGHEFRLEDSDLAVHGERFAVRPDTRLILRLEPGERATPHPAGGFIVAHPDHAPVWWREENGAILCTKIEPADAGSVVPTDLFLSRRYG